MQNLRLASTGELDADVAHRLIEHIKNTYGLEEEVVEPPRVVATVIPEDEQRAAEDIWRALEALPFAEQRSEVQRLRPRSAALFHVLRRQSRIIGRQDRERGVQLAELALDSLHATGGHLPPVEWLDLRSQGWTCLGDAQRLNQDFEQADESFKIAALHVPTPFAVGWREKSVCVESVASRPRGS